MGIKLTSNFDQQAAIPLDSRNVAATIVARDAIPASVRYEGLMVYVPETMITYMLLGGVANSDWGELSAASGGSSYVHPTTPGNMHVPAGGSTGQALTWSEDGVAQWATIDIGAGETVTSLSITGNVLRYTDEAGDNADIDLSLYLDDTNLSRLTSGVLDAGTGIATFSRDDLSTFTLDLSSLSNGVFYSQGTSAPASPSVGDEWFNTDTGILYKRVSDGVDEVWFDFTGTGMVSASGTGGVATGVVHSVGVVVARKSEELFDDVDVVGAVEVPFDGTIQEIRAKTASGSATVDFKLEGAIIGSINATTSGVSSTISQAVTSWDDITIDVSNAAGSGLVVTLIVKES